MRRFAALRRRSDFARLRRHGQRSETPYVTMFLGHAHPLNRPLVGISVSGRVGNAVQRNRAKRRIAAALQDLPLNDPGMRLLVIARAAVLDATYEALREDLRRVL